MMKDDFQRDEENLLFCLSKGEEQAFRYIYDKYSVGIYRVAFRYLRSSALAEDVVQEIFLKIWLKKGALGGVLSIRSYLFTMCKNLCLKNLKELADRSDVHEAFFRLTDSDAGDDDREGYQELLRKAVTHLPPQQKQVFELAKLEGLSHDVIAQKLNLSSSTVNNHITAALRTIRKSLQHLISICLLLLGYLP